MAMVGILMSAPTPASAGKGGWAGRVKDRIVRVFSSKAKTRVVPPARMAKKAKPSRARDIKVSLPHKHVALDDGIKFLAARIKKELPAKKLDDHAARLRHRKLSVAFAKGNKALHKLDLAALVPADLAGSLPALRATLQQLDLKPAATWMTGLGLKYNKLKSSESSADRTLARAVLAVYRHVEKSVDSPALKKQAVAEAFLQRLSAGLIRRAGRRSTANLLPADLPAFPSSDNKKITKLVKLAATRGSRQRQLSYLERQGARLRGSNDAAERALGQRLIKYLADYKAPWSEAWVQRAMKRFHGADSPLSWNLRSDVVYTGKVAAKYKDKLQTNLDMAWTIISAVVHPELLGRLPPVKVLVEHNRKRAAHNDKTIKLGPTSSLRAILHEFGHHIEDHGGPRPFSVAQGVREQRANTSVIEQLKKLLPKKKYKDGEKAYPGGFVTAYMGKHYSGGYTEIISMGLERFHDPKKVAELFASDGDMVLKVLGALQRKP